MQTDIVAATTTTKPERLDEYALALRIRLKQEEMKEILEVGDAFHLRTTWWDRFKEDDRS
jgi:diketogulonate reductase-like aldo/keto reductase